MCGAVALGPGGVVVALDLARVVEPLLHGLLRLGLADRHRDRTRARFGLRRDLQHLADPQLVGRAQIIGAHQDALADVMAPCDHTEIVAALPFVQRVIRALAVETLVIAELGVAARSEESRVGTEWVSTCRSR